MTDRLTSPDEAALLSETVNDTVAYLERLGFDRGQIGATMAGISFGLIQVHSGHPAAMDILKSVSDAMMADAATKN